MATGLWGSICLQDFLEKCQVAQAPDGSTWLNLSSLPPDRFKRSDKNGKIYAGINVWINDELDEYQNAAGISFQQSQEERARQEKRKYVGNLKYIQAAGTAASPGVAPAASTPWGAPAATPPKSSGGFGQATTPVTQQALANGASTSNNWTPVKPGTADDLPF